MDKSSMTQGRQLRYRTARPLPFELRQHCGIYFEEELYNQSLDLLISLLSAGSATSSPAYVPTPQHLALAATLVVHPLTTTRAKTADKAQASITALRLLRLTNELVGPVGAKLESAFKFTALASRHGGRRKSEHVIEDDGSTLLSNPLAQEGSLWERAEDFWHVVGWAFNCSILYAKRWERWHLFLEFACEVLEDDFNQRIPIDDHDELALTAEECEKAIELSEGSLLLTYVKQAFGGYGSKRRILRSIFADGSSKSTNEFREVFKNEPKESKKDGDKKFEKIDLNIDEGSFGDYLDHDDDESSEADAAVPQRRSGRATRIKQESNSPRAGNPVNARCRDNADSSALGDIASIGLRQRLLCLLVHLAIAHPDEFATVDETYTLLVEFVKPLPLATFGLFVAPSISPNFTEDIQISLCEVMLQTMIESDAPTAPATAFDQAKLEKHYLPYAASSSSVLDNTKFSLLVESLLRILALDVQRKLDLTPGLSEAVHEGIQGRVEKVQRSPRAGQKNSKKGEDLELEWLLESGQRMLHLAGAS